MTETNNKECIYLSAVAKYKLGKHVEARRQIKELLKVKSRRSKCSAACCQVHTRSEAERAEKRKDQA